MSENFEAVEKVRPSAAERAEMKAQRAADAEVAMTDHNVAQAAFNANRERLKAERLAREANAAPVPSKKRK